MLMNEIEKLYENVGIEKRRYCFAGCKYAYCNSCDNCSVADKMVYPPFTAEKQLELIKWLGELDMLEIMRTIREDKAWIINSQYGMSGNVYKHASRKKSFEETLAKLINSLWQDLTKEEKRQIKEILE